MTAPFWVLVGKCKTCKTIAAFVSDARIETTTCLRCGGLFVIQLAAGPTKESYDCKKLPEDS